MQTYYRSGKSAIHDECRNKLIPDNPEERVRQELVRALVNEMNVPKQAIDTEYPLNQHDETIRLRADIVVWAKEDDSEVALLVIEVIAPNVVLTDTVFEQAMQYRDILQCDYFGVTNSSKLNDLILYQIQSDGIFARVKNKCTYSDLIQPLNLEYVRDSVEFIRKPYHEITSVEYINLLLHDDCIIGIDTPSCFHHFIAELDNFILTEECTCHLPANFHGISICRDLSWKCLSYGNAGGGNFPNYYRGFIVKDIDGDDQIYRLSLNSTGKFENHPFWGNRKGTTVLLVAIDDFDRSPHAALELCMDRSLETKGTYFNIVHDGRMTVGKRGAIKRSIVVDYIREAAPVLIRDNKVFLGSLPATRSIRWDEGQDFICRLFLYANLRDKIRDLYR